MGKSAIPTLLAITIIGSSVLAVGRVGFIGTSNREMRMSQEASVVNVGKSSKIKKRNINRHSSAHATFKEISTIRSAGTFLSKNHYVDLKRRLDDLAGQGFGGLEPYYQAIEQVNPFTVAIKDVARQAGGTMREKPNCVSNPYPVFTKHITDIDTVKYIGPPPTMGAGPSLKTHGYIGTDHARVPVYAPADMTVKDGSYYVHGPYMFDFQVSCEVTVRFGHMTDPVDVLKKLLPNEPATDSRTHELSPISFKAGELVGYTTGTNMAGNWDYGVYNSSVSNRYASDSNWNNSATYTTAVCPFDYFTVDLKAAYASKFKPEVLGGNPQHGESFCKF